MNTALCRHFGPRGGRGERAAGSGHDLFRGDVAHAAAVKEAALRLVAWSAVEEKMK